MQIRAIGLLLTLLAGPSVSFAESKPKLTLDDFFNSVRFSSIELSPEGKSVVIGTERADWDQQIFRNDLWLYRDDANSKSAILGNSDGKRCQRFYRNWLQRNGNAFGVGRHRHRIEHRRL